ncbi:MAG: hypothetical protein ACI849_001456, partial [Patiriisocius sp.]
LIYFYYPKFNFLVKLRKYNAATIISTFVL